MRVKLLGASSDVVESFWEQLLNGEREREEREALPQLVSPPLNNHNSQISQISQDICKYFQMFSDSCRYLQIFSDICRYLQIFSDSFTYLFSATGQWTYI